MPVIVQKDEQTRYAINAPVPIDSAVEKRGPGDAIAQAGQVLDKTVTNVSDLYAQAQEAHRAVSEGELKMQMQQVAQDARVQAIRTAKADGSDLTQKYTESFDNLSAPILSKVDSPDLRERAGLHAAQAKGQIYDDMTTLSLKMIVQNTSDIQERAMNTASVDIRNDPSKFNERWADFQKTTADMQAKGVFSPIDAQKALREGGENFALAVINGHLDKGEYNAARGAIKDFSQYIIDTDAKGHKDVGDLMSYVDTAETGALKANAVKERQDEIHNDRVLKDISSRNARSLIVQLEDAKDDPDKRAQVIKSATTLFGQGKLLPGVYNAINVSGRRMSREDEAKESMEIISAMNDGDDQSHYDDIEQTIASHPTLSNTSKARLLKASSDAQNNVTAVGRKRMKDSDAMIKEALPYAMPSDLQAAHEERNRLMKEGNLNPQEAAKAAAKKMVAPPDKTPEEIKADLVRTNAEFKKISASATPAQKQAYLKALEQNEADYKAAVLHSKGNK